VYSLKDTELAGFTIEANTGAINLAEGNNLAEGTYPVSISIVNASGFSVDYPEIFTLVVKPVGAAPELYYTQAGSQVSEVNITTGEGFELEIAGSTEDLGSGLVYAFKDTDIEGLTIASTTGAISLAAGNTLAEGSYPVSLTVTDDANKTIDYDNIFTIAVTQPVVVELNYTNAGTEFSSVAISSWTGFTATVGETSGLGDAPVYALENNTVTGLSIDTSTGEITLAEDSNVAEGTYNVSVSVDNAGTVHDFDNIFAITVANSWEQVFFDDRDESVFPLKEAVELKDGPAPNPAYKTSKLNNSDTAFKYFKNDPQTDGFVPYGCSVNLLKDKSVDSPLLLEIVMEDDFRKAKVSFGETSVGKIQTDGVKRRFYYGYSKTQIFADKVFDASEWEELIATDSDKWAKNNYKTGFKTIESEFEISDPSKPKLVLQWRMTSTMPSTGMTRLSFSKIKVDVSKKTDPVFTK